MTCRLWSGRSNKYVNRKLTHFYRPITLVPQLSAKFGRQWQIILGNWQFPHGRHVYVFINIKYVTNRKFQMLTIIALSDIKNKASNAHVTLVYLHTRKKVPNFNACTHIIYSIHFKRAQNAYIVCIFVYSQKSTKCCFVVFSTCSSRRDPNIHKKESSHCSYFLDFAGSSLCSHLLYLLNALK